MQKWEYYTTILDANIDLSPVPLRDDIEFKEHPEFSVHSLIPQLDRLGRQGWELVSMDPVSVGKRGDVVLPVADSTKWGRSYLCAFKRPVIA